MARRRSVIEQPDPNAVFEECFCCGKKFQMGPHRYDGKYIAYYKISLCQSCYAGNWDGIGPYCEERLVAHLNENNIPVPSRNGKGWLPRDP
jgi:hypothetical protein